MFVVFIDAEILKGIFEHARQYGEKEAIGKLVGRPYVHPTVDYWFIDIWGFVPVMSVSTSVSVRYSSEAAHHLGEDLLIDHDEDMVVGWYHSHPRMGCFMSQQDLKTQQTNYPEWYHCAMVVDPFTNDCKIFKIDEEGYLVEVEYYVYRKK